mgnify:CR=1 FL=1
MVWDAPPERHAELRRVEQLPLQVREHRPEAAQRLGRHAHAERRQVALQERAHELVTPLERGFVVGRKQARRVAAAQPQRMLAGEPGQLRMQLAREERRQLDLRDAAGERLGALAQQRPRRRAEEEEAPRAAVGVDLGAQRGKQLRQPLHPVEHDEALAHRGQEEFGAGEGRAVGLALEVEDDGAGVARRDRARQRRLADLPRADEHDGGMARRDGVLAPPATEGNPCDPGPPGSGRGRA